MDEWVLGTSILKFTFGSTQGHGHFFLDIFGGKKIFVRCSELGHCWSHHLDLQVFSASLEPQQKKQTILKEMCVCLSPQHAKTLSTSEWSAGCCIEQTRNLKAQVDALRSRTPLLSCEHVTKMVRFCLAHARMCPPRRRQILSLILPRHDFLLHACNDLEISHTLRPKKWRRVLRTMCFKRPSVSTV